MITVVDSRPYSRNSGATSCEAQRKGAGNPVARTYWRWQLSWNPLALYQPASSGVGMFQMTDAAFAEARQFCVRNHIVLQDDCRFGSLYIRAIQSHAIELAAVYLVHNLERIFAGPPTAKPSAEHKRELASMIHLCGAVPSSGHRELSARHRGLLWPLSVKIFRRDRQSGLDRNRAIGSAEAMRLSISFALKSGCWRVPQHALQLRRRWYY